MDVQWRGRGRDEDWMGRGYIQEDGTQWNEHSRSSDRASISYGSRFSASIKLI